ncbi:hypothetical protein FD28_GL000413 [Levilactobacillus hammesii DSM 16381]|uniref:Integral membrane protein n=2 Tax=Levilactobacillus hammesii TaxID=267633 RepID=A0A0R1UM47_9LACO|nr:hypothetical protein FD28_GL000413 [Levilactobacillus hammesii DSM 16381]
MSHHLMSRRMILALSFSIPIVIMSVYFAYRHMEPFGSNSLLTVDLGQQYVDFFSYFRRAILRDPSSIFFSFSNGLGGEMLGTWAYYLLSPLNWILLFFSGTTLTTGIYFLTVIKYGLGGLAFSWLLIKATKQSGLNAVAFSTMYALMGWFIANQLNIIWMDTIYLLPLVFYGLYSMLRTGKWRTYVIWLTIALVVNYYMAFMICLFMVLQFIVISVDQYTNRHDLFYKVKLFLKTSIVSALLAAFVLLPTWWSLSQSKAQYTVKSVQWKFEYFPFKMISKLFSGTFTFAQMENGMPNLFIGAIALLGALFYFFDNRVKIRTRITAGFITFFLALSMCYQPLDLLWHAGQFPVWYPYRFSFVVGFWLIWLASQTITKDFEPSWKATLLIFLIVSIGIVYIGLTIKDFKYLQMYQIILGIVFLVLAFILILSPIKHKGIYPVLFLIVAITDVSTNMVISLDNINYTPQSEYSMYTNRLQVLVNKVQRQDKGFYRIGKTFLRTKGDAFQTGFNGGGVFTSVLPQNIPAFYGHIGSVDGAGFVDYTNGSLLTDSLLNMKYFFHQKVIKSGAIDITNPLKASANKADLSAYRIIDQTQSVDIYKNSSALPLGYVANRQILSLKNGSQDPTKFQGNWLAALTGNSLNKQIFSVQNFNKITFDNVQKQYKVTEAVFKKVDNSKPASFSLYFKPKTNDSYYLTLGAQLNEKTVSFLLNDKPLAQSNPYRHTVLVSVANHAKGKLQKLTVNLPQPSIHLQNFTLYSLNSSELKTAVDQLKSQPWKIKKHTNRFLIGDVNSTQADQVLNTSIPYSQGWTAKINGKKVKTYKTVDMFTAVKLPKGQSTVSFSYWPPLLNIGVLVSSVTLLGLVGYRWINYKKKS